MKSNRTKRRISIVVAFFMIFSLAMPLHVNATEVEPLSVSVAAESDLLTAIATASTDSSNPTTISLTDSITLQANLTIPQDKFIILSGATGAEKLTVANPLPNRQDAQKSETIAMIMVNGNLTLKDIVIDGNQKMRCISVMATAGATLTLDRGATVTRGMLGMYTATSGANIKVETGKANAFGTLILNTGAKITDATPYGTASVVGLGVYVGAYGNFVMSGGEISGNSDFETASKTSNGGGVYLNNYGGSFLMTGGEIKNNFVCGNGGGIYLQDGTYEFRGGSVTGNKCLINGGGIYTASKVNIDGGLLSGNISESKSASTNSGSGGGIFIHLNGIVTMNSGAITSNIAKTTATSNPNGYSFAQGGGVFSHGKFLLNGGSISDNSAVSSSNLPAPVACGGGVAVPGGTEFGGPAINSGPFAGFVDLNGGVIQNNTAQNLGGGVFLSTEETTTPISEQVPTVEYTIGSANARLSGSPIVKDNKNKTANDNIWLMKDAILTLTGEMQPSAKILVDGADLELGSVIAEASNGYMLTPGDARVFWGNNGEIIYDYNAGKIVKTEAREDDYVQIESALIGNISQQIYSGSKITPEPEVTLAGTSLQKDVDFAYSYVDNINAGTATIKIIGQGNYSGTATATFAIEPKAIDTVTAQEIRARIYTGVEMKPAVHLLNGAIELSDGTDFTSLYTDNIDVGTATITITGCGNYTGMILLPFAIQSADAQTIVNTENQLQSAIDAAVGTPNEPAKIYTNKTIELSENLNIPADKYIHLIGNLDDTSIVATSVITSSALEAFVRVEGGLILDNLSLIGNQKCRTVMVATDGALELSADTYLKGGTELDGAGIYNYGTLLLHGGVVEDNKKTGTLGSIPGHGGGIYNAQSGTFVMTSGFVRGNQNTLGGGIYNAGTFTMMGGLVTDNGAVGNEYNLGPGEGGGVYNAGDFLLSGGSIDVNTATEFGGGLSNDGHAVIQAGSIRDNDATRAGGGIYTKQDLTLEDGVIHGNRARSLMILRFNGCGGGIYVANGNFVMNGGVIDENSAISTYTNSLYHAAMGCGGGVYVSNDRDNPCKFTMNGGIISANTASSPIQGKEAGHGGGVYVLGGNAAEGIYQSAPGSFTMTGGQVTGNKASDTGSGVFMNNQEKAINSGSFATPIGVDSFGPTVLSLYGSAEIIGNAVDNLYLCKGVTAKAYAAFSTGVSSIGVTHAQGGDTPIVQSTPDYTLTASDATAFTCDETKRTVAFSDSNRAIILKGIELKSQFKISLTQTSAVYTGAQIRPAVSVVDTATGQTSLKEGSDYQVVWGTDTTKAGEKTITVKGMGNYTGTLTATFTINPKNVSTLKVSPIPDYKYTGSTITPVSAIVIKDGSKTLLRGEDYKIVSYASNKEPGTAKITIEGVGNYNKTRVINFKIGPKPMKGLSIASIATQKYAGKAIKPVSAISIKDGSYKLVKDKDYKIVSYTNNNGPGIGKIKVKGAGKYTGERVISFNIAPKQTSISKMTSAQKSTFSVTWKKDTKVSGYEVVVATDKKFTKNKKSAKISSYKTVTKKFTKLKAKKTYYARVRSYKTIGGKKYYSLWSTVKNGKTK
ncbi:MAG: hypothetical protein LBN22_08955 [Clostridiales Family XIII bacterium]|jgi:hypothetical protein|nr:hypothetical protein [Clostridiales Family XIII bacterium]